MEFSLNDFPTLSQPIQWGTVTSRFIPHVIFEESLISNISIIPTVRDQYVVMKLLNGQCELPGGTLEPGETYLDCIKREAMEELGAELIDLRIFGHFACRNSADKPYRPHLPFPNFVRLAATGEVNIVSKPLNPDGGEHVIAVDVVDIDEAVRRYKEIGRSDIAELYLLAHKFRNSNDGGV